MNVALMAIGAMLGFALNSGHGTETLLTMLLGGFAGYALGELHSLSVRSRELEKEVGGLKERLAAMQRQQREGLEPRPAASMTSGWSRATIASSDPKDATPLPQSAPSDETLESGVLRVVREFFTGGNTVVRVGILILFFGVAFLLRYVAEHSHIPIEFRLSGVAELASIRRARRNRWVSCANSRLERAGQSCRPVQLLPRTEHERSSDCLVQGVATAEFRGLCLYVHHQYGMGRPPLQQSPVR